MNSKDQKNLHLDHERLRADWNRLSELTKMDAQRYRNQMKIDLQAFNTLHHNSMKEFRAQMDQFRQSIGGMRYTMSKENRRRIDEHNHRSNILYTASLLACVLVGVGLGLWVVFR